MTSKKTNDILIAIYNLLNNRMPGERSPDIDSVLPKTEEGTRGGFYSRIKDSFSKSFGGSKDKLKEASVKLKEMKDKTEGYGKDARRTYDSVTGKAKGKAKDGMDRLYDLIEARIPAIKTKRFDDKDGDGVRDGSIDDLRSRRQKVVDAVKEKASKAGSKVKSSSPYAALIDFFKKKKSEKEEDKDGIGLDDAVDALDGSGADNDKKRDAKRKRRLEKTRANNPQGRIGKIMSGAGNLLKKIPGVGAAGRLASRFGGSMAGRGLGMLGRGAMTLGGGALSMLGGNLLGGAGRIALGAGATLLGGGISSAGILTGGLGMLSSALGMAATGVVAILSSPITVPALALAAAGTAGYFAYKWLTKPDPQPIEKVRMVQYGFRSTDLDAYKKIKSLEQKVAGCVTFSGEKAEFDAKKLNIQDMMKVFDLDPSDEADARKFVDWFAGRFRPVYLNHRALIKTIASPKPLEDVDDNKVELKKRYLDQCLFPGPHYSVSTNPNKGSTYLFTSQGSVSRQIEESKAEVEKKGDTKPEEKKPLTNAATLAAAAAAKAEDEKRKLAGEKKLDDAANPVSKANTDRTSTENRVKAAKMAAMAAGGPGSGPVANDPTNPVNAPSGPNGEPARPKSKNGLKPKTGDAAIVKAEMIKKMPSFGITSINQQAALLGNADHESGFQPISENLNYKASTLMKLWPNRFPTMESAQKVASLGPEGIANSIYGGRMGNTDPTDGWDYRGRGPFQLTGKSNYALVGKVMGKDIVNDPDKLITDPVASAESALAYWKLNPQLGKLADAGNFDRVRQIINGGNIGAADAAEKVQQYLDQLKNKEVPGATGPVRSNMTDTPVTVASPKPTSVENNPNMGPTPSSYSSPKPSSMVASPRPSYDQSTNAGTAPTSSVRSATTDSFYQSQSKVNTGDSIDIMKKSNEELGKHTSLLTRIADGIDALPGKLAEVMASSASAAPASTPAPVQKKTEAKPMTTPSLGFRRSLAGT